MKKKLTVLLILTMIVGMVAGCGSKGSSAGSESKDSLEFGIVSTLESFDNAKGQNSLDFIVRRCLYDPLVYVDAYTGKEEMRLAESYDVNDKKTEYIFHLRENVQMHDGSVMDADDVVFSLQLAKDSADVGKNLAAMQSVEAVDNKTVKVTLSYPTVSFIKGLSMIFIISEDQYNSLGQEAFSEAPIGTGPYKFVSYENENKIKFEAFDKYYRGEAAIKSITIRQFGDANALAVAVESEEIDTAFAVSPTSIEDIATNKNIVVNDVENTKQCLMAINITNDILDNVKLRQAINYAIDRDFIVESAREGRGKATSLVFVSKFDFTKNVKDYSFDLEQAKKLLAESGEDVSNASFTISTYSACKTEAEAIKSNLEALGINTKIELLEGGTLYSNMMAGNFQISIYRSGTSIDDPDQYYNCYTEAGIGTANYPRYVNDKVKSLMDAAKFEVEIEERNKIYEEALGIIQEDCPVAGIYEMPDICTSAKDLNVDWGFNGMFYLYDFSWK